MKIPSPYFSRSDTYTYDHTGSRISSQNSTNTTLYVSKLYNILSTGVGTSTTATTTAYTFLTDTPIAITEMVNTATPTIRYLHPDHLGSTNAVTDTAGTILQALDYYPYGQTRMNTGSYTPQRQYIGQYYDTDTSLNYLNARYYDGGRGQFLSEDPTFLGNPKTQNLMNPQNLNSYSYADDNPINKSDPSGRCPTCLLALGGAGAGIVGQFGYDVYNNIQAGGWGNAFSNFSSAQVYGTRAVQGAIIGATGGLAGGVTASIVGQAAIVVGASGLVGAGGNAYLGDPVTLQSVAADTVIGGLTFGAGRFVPGVSGRLPNLGTKAFFGGAHTQQSAMQLGVGSISNYTSQLIGGFNFSNPSASGGAAAAQNAARALGIGNSGGGTFVGTYNFGPGVGTFNFGTGSWVSTAQSTPATIKK